MYNENMNNSFEDEEEFKVIDIKKNKGISPPSL